MIFTFIASTIVVVVAVATITTTFVAVRTIKYYFNVFVMLEVANFIITVIIIIIIIIHLLDSIFINDFLMIFNTVYYNRNFMVFSLVLKILNSCNYLLSQLKYIVPIIKILVFLIVLTV